MGERAPRLRNLLPERSVDTLAEHGWSDKDNGKLLDLAEMEGYEVFVATDPSLRHQQDLADRRIGVVVWLAMSGSEARLRASEIGQAIAAASAGEIVEVPIRVD